MEVTAEDIGTVRAFNRFYTGVMGVLGEGLVRSPYSLTEARVIFELAQREDAEVLALRRALDLDAGYLSRMLARFEADGLLVRERRRRRPPPDRPAHAPRPRGVRHAGRADRRRDPRPAGRPARRRPRPLLAAMRTVHGILGDRPRPDGFVLRPPRPGDLGWVVERNGALYDAECGWDRTYEALVASVVAGYVRDHDPERENAWIAESDGVRVGGVFCVKRA